MADNKVVGGGYGRFYSVEEKPGAATTASEKISKALSNGSTVSGLTNVTADLEKLKTSIINGNTNLGKNILNQVPGVQAASANAAASISNLSLQDSEKYQNKITADLKPPLPNILSYYSSYNYIFTLSVLSPEQLNFPDQTYKKGKYGPLILRSAGGVPDKELVDTQYGKYDFYIDDLQLNGIVGFDKISGNTSTNQVSFKIFEPYSMGLFFQSLQAAAFGSGYLNYLDLPLLLTIEFKGHIFEGDTQLLNQQIENTTKHIPMRLYSVQMQVSGKGSTYDIRAFPFNELGFSKQFNQAKTELNIRANMGGPYTVQSVLQTGEQSLQAIINQYFKTKVKNKDIEVADQCLILFPTDLSSDTSNQGSNERLDKSATTNPVDSSNNDVFKKLGVSYGSNNNAGLIQGEGDKNVNKIGQANIGFNALNKGDTPFPKDVGVYDEATGIYQRGKVTIDYKNADFKFNQGTAVTDAINQVILASDYGRNALSVDQRSEDGQIYWWRVETELYTLNAPESNKSGIKPKLVVYRVVPYKVDGSFVLPINTKRTKLDKIEKQSLKEYNYIYTGKNTEILDFNIDFKAGFYTPLPSDGNRNSESKEIGATSSAAANQQSLDELKYNAISANPAGAKPNAQQTPQQMRNDLLNTSSYKQGGSGVDDPATKAAKHFHDIITQGFDMINLELKIMGDPYYIADSGLGNYTAKGVKGFDNITSDGSVNYQNGQVIITVNFRTPIDINMETGFYNFGDTKPLLQFSGLYIVQKLTSSFLKGKFTQVLKLMRMRGQDNPNAPEPEKPSILAAENISDSIAANNFVKNTNTNILAAIQKSNNVNSSPPNTSLPGVINSGGFTI